MLEDHNPSMVNLLNNYGVTAPKMPSQREFYKAGQDQFQEARFHKVGVEEAMALVEEGRTRFSRTPTSRVVSTRTTTSARCLSTSVS